MKNKDELIQDEDAILEEITARLIKIRKTLGMNKKDFALSLGKNSTYLTFVESRQRRPGITFFINLGRLYNVSMEYIFRGVGDMFISKARHDDNVKFIDDISSNKDIYWLMENSPMVNSAISAFVTKYFYENESIIRRNADKFRKQKEKEKSGSS
jgi:transcriptional regulator with XRE-family HTH domain